MSSKFHISKMANGWWYLQYPNGFGDKFAGVFSTPFAGACGSYDVASGHERPAVSCE